METKQDHRESDGQRIGNGFCQVDGQSLIGGPDPRHQENERDQQDKFPGDCHGNVCLGISQGVEGHLAGDLNTEQQHDRHVDPQGVFCKFDEGRIVGKQGGEDLGEKHDAEPQEGGIDHVGRKEQTEGRTNPVCIFCTIIIAHNGLGALAQALKRQHGKLHHTCQDRHGADGNISSVFEQGRVEADGNDTFACLHDESGKPKGQAGKNDLFL